MVRLHASRGDVGGILIIKGIGTNMMAHSSSIRRGFFSDKIEEGEIGYEAAKLL